jgi:hypothetical protein
LAERVGGISDHWTDSNVSSRGDVAMTRNGWSLGGTRNAWIDMGSYEAASIFLPPEMASSRM